MKNKTYDRLKIITLVVIPFILFVFSGAAAIFNIPYGSQICAFIGIIQAGLGTAIVTLSKIYHNKELAALGEDIKAGGKN